MATFPELLANLDPSPQVRGRQFEKICKWYLENEPGYRSQLKRVWLWNDWPNAWGADAGIDLVAEATNGELWAIQAKAYSEDHSITKRDVDTFLSESSRQQFTFRLLIATTNEIGRTADRTFRDQEKPAGRLFLADLERYELDWPGSPADLRPARPKPKNPRSHQREAIDAVLTGFENTDRGRLIMACGTGKTLVGLWVAEELESERTLVLLPSLSLLAQTLREWTANANRPFAFLPVCSDETVRGSDHFVSNTSDLGFPVTTDPAQIAAFLNENGPSVMFSTYQSSPRIAEALESCGASFDLAIADEAHRCAGPVSSDFATILDNSAIDATHRLFQTATPRYFTDRVRRVADEAEYEIASMDEAEHFGPEFYSLSFGEAIERDLLSDYRVVIVGVGDPTYREYVKEGTLVSRDGKGVTNARYLAAQIALAKAMRDYDLRRMISFHSRIKSAREFGNEFPKVVAWMPEEERPKGDLWCDHVHGKMTSGQRDKRLRRLRELDHTERGLLTNARCLGEGVDVPTLDGVAFIDPRSSQVDIIQAVGRAIRKTEDKKVGTIVLPVFIEETDDPKQSLHSSVFKPVWQVLRALRAHDEKLAEQIDEMRQRVGKEVPTGPHKIIIEPGGPDIPTLVGPEFAEAFWTETALRVGEKPNLSVSQILEWADSHKTRTGSWPRLTSGQIEDAPSESWSGIHAALQKGYRGLQSGGSLARLLHEQRGVINYRQRPLTEKLILTWIEAFHEATGSFPNTRSGDVQLPEHENWRLIDDALRRGTRGLSGGSSLTDLLARERGVGRRAHRTQFNLDRLLVWADAHHRRTGKWPSTRSGPIVESPNDTWQTVASALRRGGRGLPGGSSLAELLNRRRGIERRLNTTSLSEAQILTWADAHRERTGRWPSTRSGLVPEAPETTWHAINHALRDGARGLNGGGSLEDLLSKRRGVRRRPYNSKQLSEVEILAWADAYYERSGKWPVVLSGPIPGTDDTWNRVHTALRNGHRGLPGGSSLAKLLDEHRRKKQ